MGRWLATALVALTCSCGDVKKGGAGGAGDGGAGDGADGGGGACDPDQEDCDCEPGTVTCVGGTETRCSDGGEPTVQECLLGCSDVEPRCAEIEPSNGLGAFLAEAEGAPVLELAEGSTIDTDQGLVVVDGEPVEIASTELAAPAGGVPVRVFPVRSLSVTGEVQVSGRPALAIVAFEEIKIQGHVHVMAGAGPNGHASRGSSTDCGDLAGNSSGNGGGGFGTRGGNGGQVGTVSAGMGGAIVGTAELVPLRGGGKGSDVMSPSSGRGGGAVQLVSRTSITISNAGSVDAGGERGLITMGGGSGGGILLEAPTVVVVGEGAAVAANGGGGGCTGTITSQGESGLLTGERANGCVSSNSGDGGDGAGLSLVATNGATAASSCVNYDANGGGGGGGRGRVRINTMSGTFSPSAGAVVSPAASEGQLPIQ